ncbi:hypothetical protein D9M71_709830 [compost metagenome]
MDLLVVQGRNVDATDIAVHADHRRQACRQMKVRRFVLNGKRQQLGDIHTLLLPIDCCDWKDLSPVGSIASLIHRDIPF